jgi:Ca2+-binding EF-hand superfamily protein
MVHPMPAMIAGLWLLAAASAAHGQAKAAPAGTESNVPRAQYIASMDGEFRKMDSDKNGQLTRAEIEQYQKLQAEAQALARNQAMFAELDSDKNGRLSKAEFAKMAMPTAAANAQPILSRMDSNRDQQVSLLEHRTATVANFDRIDTDRDGNVTAAEMKAGGIAPR